MILSKIIKRLRINSFLLFLIPSIAIIGSLQIHNFLTDIHYRLEHKNINLTDRLKLGTELMNKGSHNYALKIFNNVIETDPYWSEGWNKRATLFFLIKEYDRSLYDIEKVLSLESRHFGALTGRAQIFIELKQYQKAINDLKKAKKINPSIKSNEIIPRLEKLIKGINI